MGFQYFAEVVSLPYGVGSKQSLSKPDARDWRIRETKMRLSCDTISRSAALPGVSTTDNTSYFHELFVLWELYEDEE